MVRPIDESRRRYARRPLNSILGAPSHIAVLRTLSNRATGTTGREVARHAGITPQAALDALGRLEAAGIVRRQAVGRAYAFELNRGHFLVKAGILPLLEAEVDFRERYREILKKAFKNHVVSVVIFGSVARGEDRPESDLDLCLIVERPEDRERVMESAHRIDEELWKEYGLRLSPLAFTRGEFSRGYLKGEFLYQDMVRDGETVIGKSLAEVIHD